MFKLPRLTFITTPTLMSQGFALALALTPTAMIPAIVHLAGDGPSSKIMP